MNRAQELLLDGTAANYLRNKTRAKLIRSRKYTAGEKVLSLRDISKPEVVTFVSSIRWKHSDQGGYLVIRENGNIATTPNVRKLDSNLTSIAETNTSQECSKPRETSSEEGAVTQYIKKFANGVIQYFRDPYFLVLHRKDEPAFIDEFGNTYYYHEGMFAGTTRNEYIRYKIENSIAVTFDEIAEVADVTTSKLRDAILDIGWMKITEAH